MIRDDDRAGGVVTGVLERLVAREAIEDLAVRYAMAVDDRDVDTVLSCFIPDGTFVRRGTETSGSELRPFWERMMARYGLTVHTVHGHLVTVDAGTATATGVQAGSAELHHAGTLVRASYRYRDRYARLDGRWLFARRELAFAYVLADGEPFPDGIDRIRWPGTEPEPADYPEVSGPW
jgi:ketosteroid isomerase-like protein